jgi:hypothetical protein
VLSWPPLSTVSSTYPFSPQQYDASSFADLLVVIDKAFGQSQGTYTDPATGITFATWVLPPASVNNAPQGLTIGYALPPEALTVNLRDYIGLVVSK